MAAKYCTKFQCLLFLRGLRLHLFTLTRGWHHSLISSTNCWTDGRWTPFFIMFKHLLLLMLGAAWTSSSLTHASSIVPNACIVIKKEVQPSPQSSPLPWVQSTTGSNTNPEGHSTHLAFRLLAWTTNFYCCPGMLLIHHLHLLRR